MRFKKIIAMIFVIVVTGIIWSQEAERLTVDKAVEYALKYNSSIKNAALDLESSGLTKNTVFNQFYPSISASATLSKMHESTETISGLIPDTTSEVFSGSSMYDRVIYYEQEIPLTWMLSTSIQANLTLTTQLVSGIKIAFKNYEMGQISLEKLQRQTERDVRKAFYNLLLSKEQLNIMKESLNAAEARYKQTEKLYKNGLVDQQVLLSSRVAWESMKPQISQLDMAYKMSLSNFKMMLGIALDKPIELVGEIKVPSVDINNINSMEVSFADRADIKELVGAISMQKLQKEITMGGMLPMLTFTLTADPSFSGDPFKDSWFEDMDKWSQSSGMFGLTVTLPVDSWLPGSSTWVKLANTERDIKKLRNQLEDMLKGAKMSLDSHLLSVKTAMENLEASNLNLELAKTSYNLAEEAYKSGLKDLVAVMDAENTLRQAQFSVLSTKAQILNGLIDLAYDLNQPIDQFIGGEK
ncbi:TolC family protein [Spirochaetia bacterium 38H-sp]|uniref:TolC family protein n=1 Tax=Rarispira pelagica TaxID=3141764 RepID=A0ABU9U9N8_9SPIR